MADETNSDPRPQLTGIVIITLPPPDNPSFGKTFTAFTLSDNQTLSTSQSVHPVEETPTPPPPPLPQNLGPQQPSSSVRNFSRSSLRNILPILSISLIALYLWGSISEEALFELGDDYVDNDDDNHKNKSQTTFIFPLYRKPYIGNGELGDVELKLGRFRSWNEFHRKIHQKSVSASSKIESTTTSVIPVGGNVYLDGLYYTYLHFGNPLRPYFLDVDTGSDLTWIQCDAPCSSCAKGAHPFYKPLKANIISHKDSYCLEIQNNQKSEGVCDSCHQCDYEIEYADHSSSMGVLARDELALNIMNGSSAKSKVVFGCAYNQQGLLLNTLGKTDGILGLSRAKISLPSQLASQGIIKNIVGHCLATDSSGGGYLFFGDDFLPQWQMSWVPMLQSLDSNSYQTELMKVNYGSKQIGLGIKGAQNRIIFDTGSSYSYFTEEAYNNLVDLLKVIPSESLVLDTLDTSLPVCWRAKSPLRSIKNVRQMFKPLILQFRSKWWILSRKLQIPPEGYLVINSKGNVCLGILNGRNVHDGSTFILGDISLRGLMFVYDNVNEKIGWIRSDCSKPTRFESHSANPFPGL